MLETTRETARNVTMGTRALVKGERRPFRASAPALADARIRSNVLHTYPSRTELELVARRQAILGRGRRRFMESRVVGLGVPLGIAAGVLAWRTGRSSRGRSVAQFVVAFTATLGLALLEAAAEWRGMEEAGGG